jgi:o-succinylbenzoate synthase
VGGALKVRSVELRRVRMPLVSPFRASYGVEATREVLLLRAETDDGEGWGECGALSEPLYASEYVDACEHVLRHHLVPRLLAAASLDASGVAECLSPVQGHRMAKAALEMAVLDAELRMRGESFASYLGAVRDHVDAGLALGIAGSVAELLEAVSRAVAEGYRRVKLKIEPGWDVEPVRAVRSRFPDLPLQVDANGAYSLGDAEHLAGLDASDLLLIEQPLPADRLGDHAELGRRVRTPICLDESIVSAPSAADAIALGACHIVNVKPGRVGGYLEARRVHDVCRAHDVPVWCGGMLETGLGRAGNAALAALPGFTLPGDLSASARYYARDLTAPFVLEGGRLRVPGGPGLGVDVDPAVLREVTTAVDVIGRDRSGP